MNELKVNDTLKDKIHLIRGKYVMLDSDLAIEYQCTNGTKDINKAVKRNIERFPEDFMFQLTKEEYDNLKFQFGTSSVNTHGGVRKLPYVFTEQGVSMLSSVLHTEVAINASIRIIRTFVELHHYLSSTLLEQKYYNDLTVKNSVDILKLQEQFNKYNDKISNNHIFFKGQIYEAYSKIIDIFSFAKEELIIIDPYADKKLLDIISNIKVNTIVITKTKTLLNKNDIIYYNKNHNNLKIIYDDTFHDRYYIIDKKQIYHSGTSFNYIGTKTFGIDVIGDNDVINLILNNIYKIIKK